MIVDVEIAPGIWYKLNEFSSPSEKEKEGNWYKLADFKPTENPIVWFMRIVWRNPDPKKTPWRAPLVILEKRP
jgi:hypothetical protein